MKSIMGVNENNKTTPRPSKNIMPGEDAKYDVIDVDSEQDKYAAALVQSILLTHRRLQEEKNMENNNNLSAQEILALQQMQAMQQQQGGGMQSTLLTGAKYAAIFGAGFIGAKLFFNGGSKDVDSLIGSVSDLFD